MFVVYVIYSTVKNKRYFGQTDNLERRLFEHNSGYSPSTKSGKPWIVIATKEFETRAEAFVCERRLKSLKSREKQDHFLIRNGFRIQEVIGPEKSPSLCDG